MVKQDLKIENSAEETAQENVKRQGAIKMAKLDTTKIEGYESMTPEQKLAALEGFEIEDVSTDLNRYKTAVSKANSEAAEWKRKHNALLSEEEQKRAQDEEKLTEVFAELENLKKEKMVMETKSKLLSLNFDENLATDAATALLNGDNDKFFANMKKFNDNREKELKAKILQSTPEPPAGRASGEITKEKFSKMGYTELMKLQAENPALYQTLSEKK